MLLKTVISAWVFLKMIVDKRNLKFRGEKHWEQILLHGCSSAAAPDFTGHLQITQICGRLKTTEMSEQNPALILSLQQPLKVGGNKIIYAECFEHCRHYINATYSVAAVILPNTEFEANLAILLRRQSS